MVWGWNPFPKQPLGCYIGIFYQLSPGDSNTKQCSLLHTTMNIYQVNIQGIFYTRWKHWDLLQTLKLWMIRKSGIISALPYSFEYVECDSWLKFDYFSRTVKDGVLCSSRLLSKRNTLRIPRWAERVSGGGSGVGKTAVALPAVCSCGCCHRWLEVLAVCLSLRSP